MRRRHPPPIPANPPNIPEEDTMAQIEPDILAFVALIGALLMLI